MDIKEIIQNTVSDAFKDLDESGKKLKEIESYLNKSKMFFDFYHEFGAADGSSFYISWEQVLPSRTNHYRFFYTKDDFKKPVIENNMVIRSSIMPELEQFYALLNDHLKSIISSRKPTK